MVRDAGEIDLTLPPQRGGTPKERKRNRWTRSPLTTKIVAFNLVALSLLVSGILFLNQSRDGLITLREQTLQADAIMLANATSYLMDAQGSDALLDMNLANILDDLSLPSNSHVSLYQLDGTPVVGSNDPTAVNPGTTPSRTNELGDILGEAWVRISTVFRDSASDVNDVFLIAVRNETAKRAIFTNTVTRSNALNSNQQSIVVVGVPIYYREEPVGALVLTTFGGEIDKYVRDEQQSILKVFMLAILISVVLSILLANTIGRPLRILTDAAERGSEMKSGRINPGRINIPDLSARPDEIGDLSRQMRNMTEALYNRIESNASFAADVAHEIKNPLTSLRSAVETMRYAKNDDSRERLLSVIEDDVRRMDRLVTDISNVSRLDAELAKDEMEAINLNTLLTNLVDYQKGLSEELGVDVIADLPSEATIIHGNEGRLAQVFVNLITNAISFVPSGGWVKVTLRATEGNKVQIIIDDTGPGIPPDNLQDIFKRFYSSRPEQDFGNNSGLGLAISKQIVEAHGGDVWAENIYENEDKDTQPMGARFYVVLPR